MRYRTLSVVIAILLCVTLQAQEEGAPVKLKLSGKYLAPKSNYVISGSTEIGMRRGSSWMLCKTSRKVAKEAKAQRTANTIQFLTDKLYVYAFAPLSMVRR